MAENIKFEEFCCLCEKVASAGSKENKIKYLTKFFSHYRDCGTEVQGESTKPGTSIFPVLRLLLPKLDLERGPYGVKEHTLAKTYNRILCLPTDGQDAKKLLHYKGQSVGADFAEVAYWILKSRCRDGGKLSIGDVNKHLDSVATLHESNKPRSVDEELTTMLLSMSAEEQKWLIRILLKDMRFGLGQNRIFAAFHPDARDHYDVTNNLRKVCEFLKDPKKRLHEIEVTLFNFCRPMLADRCDVLNVSAVMQKAPFYFVERKHDGERFQLHMQNGTFRYYSRNGHDFTDTFGGSSNSGVLTPQLAPQLHDNVTSCILDGEMMGWNKKLQCFGSKGMNYDVKNLKEGNVHRPCMCVFDVLFLNGEVLTNKPLQDRLQILKSIFTPLEGVLVDTPRTCASDSSEVQTALNTAIDNREEGLILKDPSSVYRPNIRKGGWFKIKPEYTPGLMNELDLLIIGGYYGEGRRKANVSHFMLGLAVPPEQEGNDPVEFHSVGRVGSGYTDTELEELLRKLSPHWKCVRPGSPPPGLLWTKDRPDVWIHPRHSHILQVKASEVVESDQYQTGYTLRFPRVEKVRFDKPWQNCCTTVEFEKLRKEAGGKLATRHVSSLAGNDSSHPKRQRVPRRLLTLGQNFQPADIANITQTSSYLCGYEFCVLSGNSSLTKQELEKRIIEHGGTVVQHPGSDTYCAIAGKTDVRVKNYSAHGGTNIATVEWLLHVLESQSGLSWTPQDLLAMTLDTRQDLEMLYDHFHDSFYQKATLESLKHSLKQVSEKGAAVTLLSREMAELDEELFSGPSPFAIFRSCVAYFTRPKNTSGDDTDMLCHIFCFWGGSVCDEVTALTTHIVIHPQDVDDFRSDYHSARFKVKYVVLYDWITACWDAKKLLPERDFRPSL